MASSLVIRIGADLSALAQSLRRAENQLKKFSFKAERIGRDLSTRVSLPILAIGGAAVKTFADFDKLEKGLAAVSGSAAEGTRQFKSLLNIVKDTQTTLDLKSAAAGSLNLQAVGVSAANAERLLRQLGRAATLTGNSAQDVGEVGRQLAQSAAKGKILQQELRIILERLPGLAAVVKQEFGTVTAEGINAAGVSAQEFIERLTTAAETSKTFQNIQGGLGKAFETFGIELQIAAREVGKTIAETLNLEANLKRLSDTLAAAASAFANLNPNVQKFIVYAAAGAAAIGPLALGLGAAARSVPLLLSGLSLLAGPLGKLTALFKIFSSFAGLLIPGGGILRVVAFSKALSGLSTVFAVLSSPITLIVAAIAVLTIAFVKAYKNSQTFRFQLARLGKAFEPIVTWAKDLAKKYFPDLSAALSSVGNAFNFVFALIAGGISFVIEGIIAIVDTVKNTAGAIIDFFSLDFASAGDKLSKTLFNPATFTATAGKAAEAAVKVFNETLEGAPIAVTSFAIPEVDPTAPSGDGIKEASKPEDVIGFFLADLIEQASGLDSVTKQLSLVEKKLQEVGETAKISIQDDIFAPYRDGLELISERQLAFGDTYDALGEKISLVRGLINSMTEDDFPAGVGAVEVYTEKLAKLTAEQNAVADALKKTQETIATLETVGQKAFGAVAQSMSRGASAAKAFAQAVVGAIREAIAAKIKLAVTEAAAEALTKVPFPFNIGLAAAAGAGASALFNSLLSSLKIPLLADGGITTGAGLFVAGEAGPEAIIPLDRLNEFMRPSGGQVSGVLRADGNELIALIDTVQQQNARSF